MPVRPHLEVPGVRHRTVVTGGPRFHVAEAGPADGEPVLLLHGFPQHWYAWRRVLPLLAADHRLLCPDRRGSGWSDAPAGGYDTETGVDDVLAVLDALGLERVRLVGHQWGAGTGFAACLRAPERFSAFLALNMVHPWTDRRLLRRHAWRFWYTALWEYPHIGRRVLRHWPAFTRFQLRHGSAGPACWEPGEAVEYAAALREPSRARAGEALHWQYVLKEILFTAERREREAASLRVPTLVLAGERDPYVPAALLTDAAGLRVRAVPGCGAQLPLERPEVVAEAVRELSPANRR
jgi:pimeloyl-ACP methyl ester carboxylesterase